MPTVSPASGMQVWEAEKEDFEDLAETEVLGETPVVHRRTMEDPTASKKYLRRNAFKNFWPRLIATCLAWIANDFA